MNIIKSIIDYKDRFVVGAMLVLTVVVVVLLLPAKREFKYEFQQGKAWLHEDLFAPYSFPLYKTQEELTQEKDNLLETYHKYYNKNTKLNSEQINILKSLTAIINRRLTDSLLMMDTASVISIFDKIYEQGVVSDHILKNMDDELFLVENKIADKIDKEELLTIDAVHETLSLNLYSLYQDSVVLAVVDSLSLSNLIIPNISLNEEMSEKYKESLLNDISLTLGMIEEDVRIIEHGELVTPYKYKILSSLKKEYENQRVDNREAPLLAVGQLIVSLMSVFLLFLLLNYSDKSILQSIKKTLFVILNILSFVAMASLASRFELISIYVVPFAMLPILFKTFFKASTATYSFIVALLISANLAPNSFEFLLIQFTSGAVAIFSLGDNYRRKAIFVTSIIVFVTYASMYWGMSLIKEADVYSVNYKKLVWFASSSLLILAASPIIYIQEKLFGFVSDMTLVELSDTNNKLLRRISERTPGTFQHSLQVANLAEYVIHNIGGNALLVRVGALYHDLGKSENPQYFIENQPHGNNPHDSLEPKESAKVIINHTIDGPRLARKHNLPEQVISFMTSHHGGSKVYYFYKKQEELFPDEKPNIEDFAYPGKKPQTKEEAVLMMTDAIEAASRSLKVYTEESIFNLVSNIIDSQLRGGQLEEADLTFREIFKVKHLFTDKLKSIYHSRIEYPK